MTDIKRDFLRVLVTPFNITDSYITGCHCRHNFRSSAEEWLNGQGYTLDTRIHMANLEGRHK